MMYNVIPSDELSPDELSSARDVCGVVARSPRSRLGLEFDVAA